MEYAFSTKTQRPYSASDFSALTEAERQALKLSLVCLSCQDVAWFRSATKPGAKVSRAAHFNSHHHNAECEYRTAYLVIDDETGGGTEASIPVPTVTEYIVDLDKKVGGVIAEPIFPPIPPEGFVLSPPKGGAIGKGAGIQKETDASKTLRQILSYLKRFPDFSNSDKKVVMYSNAGQLKVNGIIRELAVNFEHVDSFMADERYRLFWGVIVDAQNEYTKNGIWLNASDSKKGVSVKIFEDIREEFLDAFKIKDLEDLKGAYVLVAGRVHFSGANNKPIIYCALPNFITIQKYREV